MSIPHAPEENLDIRRRRIRYRAWHRGTQEMDIILGNFVDAHIAGFGEQQLDRLERLMDEQDTILLSWIMGRETPPENVDRDLIKQLLKHQNQRSAKR